VLNIKGSCPEQLRELERWRFYPINKKCLGTLSLRRCISTWDYFFSSSCCLRHLNGRERRESLEGGNIPPQRYAASPKFKTGRAGRFAPQKTRLSSSSTILEGEHIPPQRSLRSLLRQENGQSRLVKVADIRLRLRHLQSRESPSICV
jgi:hypothetical protein